jgi:hypothetical protein
MRQVCSRWYKLGDAPQLGRIMRAEPHDRWPSWVVPKGGIDLREAMLTSVQNKILRVVNAARMLYDALVHLDSQRLVQWLLDYWLPSPRRFCWDLHARDIPAVLLQQTNLTASVLRADPAGGVLYARLEDLLHRRKGYDVIVYAVMQAYNVCLSERPHGYRCEAFDEKLGKGLWLPRLPTMLPRTTWYLVQNHCRRIELSVHWYPASLEERQELVMEKALLVPFGDASLFHSIVALEYRACSTRTTYQAFLSADSS